jgi:hypothetical protein
LNSVAKGFEIDPVVARETLVLVEDAIDGMEGADGNVEVDASDKSEGDGEILGLDIRMGAGIVAVKGNPRSLSKLRTFLKSTSLWNFN